MESKTNQLMEAITGKVIEFLGNCIDNKISLYFNGKDKLSELQHAMEFIQAWIYDVENVLQGDEKKTIQVWTKRMKAVFSRLEDLFDLVAIADRRQTRKRKWVSPDFYSSKMSDFEMNRKIGEEAEEILKEFGPIKAKMDQLRVEGRSLTLSQRDRVRIPMREETDPLIVEEEVIGREIDQERILQLVFDRELDFKNLSVIPIVGMGGLGKTTLAKLVYGHPRVAEERFEVKYWACISDQISSFGDLARKVLESMTESDCRGFKIGDLKARLIEAVENKKFFLVMDDVWDEDRKRWDDLKGLLSRGKRGSRILVTTRSIITARNMGTIDEPFELKGLSEDMSWSLFSALAFRVGHEVKTPRLANIGKEIVKKCANVPLAIKTIAGILYSRDTEGEWEYFRDKEIGLIDLKENDIMPTLMLSYNHLRPQQKRCFAYCSLFPKDHPYEIRELIWLWMANGFVNSYSEGHTCFLELSRKCLFQDVVWDEHHVVLSRCYMHDLIHDMAQKVGEECLLVVDSPNEAINNDIRHLHVMNLQCLSPSLSWLSMSSCMRSFLLPTTVAHHLSSSEESMVAEICSFFPRLRVLDMIRHYFKKFPTCIGELQHLRYLKVSGEPHCQLPKEITRLQFLQTLDLSSSLVIGELPRDFCKLTSLKNLLLGSGSYLRDLPPGFDRLVNLETLNVFIVGDNNGLDALSRMNLTEDLSIEYKKHRQNAISEARMANLSSKKLTALRLNFYYELSITEVEAEELLDCLQPPRTLKDLEIYSWIGTRFPNWGTNEVLNLVLLRIERCHNFRRLPSLRGLTRLRTLVITHCPELHLGDHDDDGDEWQCLENLTRLELRALPKSEALPCGIYALPMLQALELLELPNLKSLSESIGQLAELQKLVIRECPKLEALPQSFKNLVHIQYFEVDRSCRRLLRSVRDDEGLVHFLEDIGCFYHLPLEDLEDEEEGEEQQ